MNSVKEVHRGFCIYINTFCEGCVPVERNEAGYPIVYSTIEEAQNIIDEDTIERWHQFFAGERDFDDAMTVEEFIMAVNMRPDGSIVDNNDNHFGGLTS